MKIPISFRDASFLSLLFSNLITIILAIAHKWDVFTVMWIYWGQSIIIGFFHILTFLSFKKYKLKKSPRIYEPSFISKLPFAFFFMLHYGLFHAGYAFFLIMLDAFFSYLDTNYILLALLVFFINHFFSYVYHLIKERDKVHDSEKMMIFPYARIIPMHFTFMFGIFFGKSMIIIFLLLKTIADVVMHGIEHR
ncbi:hypothetical protein JXB41_09190 [Candidatus Woesearchaeota archaeon]|nr:hypothetical protein [Candidatus Woesearchaeota archaeon]